MNCCRLHCVTDAYSAMLKTVSGNSFLGSTGHRPAAVELGKTRRTQRRVLPLLPRREERGGERRCIFARVSRPGPLPEGEGTPHPARRRVEAHWIVESAAYGSPSPRGEGWGEGEETLRKPARPRTADEADYSVRSSAKLHARQSPKSLTVASRRPPHPGPLPRGEGIRLAA